MIASVDVQLDVTVKNVAAGLTLKFLQSSTTDGTTETPPEEDGNSGKMSLAAIVMTAIVIVLALALVFSLCFVVARGVVLRAKPQVVRRGSGTAVVEDPENDELLMDESQEKEEYIDDSDDDEN